MTNKLNFIGADSLTGHTPKMIRFDSCTINRIECIFQSWFMVALSPHVNRLNGVVFPINCTVSLQVTIYILV